SAVPTTVTAPMITTAMSAAMSPYSMAVAPASSRSMREKGASMTTLLDAAERSVNDLTLGAQANDCRLKLQTKIPWAHGRFGPQTQGFCRNAHQKRTQVLRFLTQVSRWI